MPDNGSNNISLGSLLRENAALIAMYALGTALFALLWWPLGLLYLGYALLSNWIFMAWLCPYCPHYSQGTCPSGYDYLSARRFQPQEGHSFAGQFRRSAAMLSPGWFLPPLAGLYLLITRFSWPVVALEVLFCLVGFAVLPYVSRQHCRRCENAANCPRGKGLSPASGP